MRWLWWPWPCSPEECGLASEWGRSPIVEHVSTREPSCVFEGESYMIWWEFYKEKSGELWRGRLNGGGGSRGIEDGEKPEEMRCLGWREESVTHMLLRFWRASSVMSCCFNLRNFSRKKKFMSCTLSFFLLQVTYFAWWSKKRYVYKWNDILVLSRRLSLKSWHCDWSTKMLSGIMNQQQHGGSFVIYPEDRLRTFPGSHEFIGLAWGHGEYCEMGQSPACLTLTLWLRMGASLALVFSLDRFRTWSPSLSVWIKGTVEVYRRTQHCTEKWLANSLRRTSDLRIF